MGESCYSTQKVDKRCAGNGTWCRWKMAAAVTAASDVKCILQVWKHPPCLHFFYLNVLIKKRKFLTFDIFSRYLEQSFIFIRWSDCDKIRNLNIVKKAWDVPDSERDSFKKSRFQDAVARPFSKWGGSPGFKNHFESALCPFSPWSICQRTSRAENIYTCRADCGCGFRDCDRPTLPPRE